MGLLTVVWYAKLTRPAACQHHAAAHCFTAFEYVLPDLLLPDHAQFPCQGAGQSCEPVEACLTLAVTCLQGFWLLVPYLHTTWTIVHCCLGLLHVLDLQMVRNVATFV